MDKQDFRINYTTVLILVIGNILLIVLGAIAHVQHWEFSSLILEFGLALYFSVWVIVLSDMAKNKIYNKTFWIMSMFIMPGIAQVFYLIQRDKLIRLGSKFRIRY